jgi:hypothetical protein
MPDVISGNGTIILDGTGLEDAVVYWLTISKEPGAVVAEGSISAPEDLLRKVKKANRATLELEDGPPLALKCVGGRNGVRLGKGVTRLSIAK